MLGAFEITIFVALAIWIIASTKGNTLAVFNPSHAASGTFSGTFKGVVFSVIALVGFESAAPLGEEARNPRWTIPRGMILAAVGLGIFYVLTSYAWVVGTGFNSFVKATGASPNPIRSLADQYWGLGWIAIIAALVTSVLANGNAAMNTASRIIYAMSRAGAMPAPFARTHRKYKTPHLAVVAQAGLGMALAVVLGVAWGPATGLGILGTLIGILIILVYITVCIAAIAYFWRKRGAGWKGWNAWLHAVLPAVGALCFLPPLYYQYRPLPPYPLRWANWAAPVWLAIGVGVTWWFARNRPHALDEARAVYVAQDVGDADVVESVPLGVQPIAR
jgi:amino acid transporter